MATFVHWSGALHYRERFFFIDAVRGSGLFQPEPHGLHPQVVSIPDVGRYQCTYGVSDGALYLEQFRLRLPYVERLRIRTGRGPRLFGREASVDLDEKERLPVLFQDLHAPIPFTGGMLLGDGYIHALDLPEPMREVRRHTAHTAICWNEVHELRFQEGCLTEAHDVSEATARLREELAVETSEPGTPAWSEDLQRRLGGIFRLDYGGLMPPRTLR
ncbi:hypothetical protein [Pyxidicoccus sp. MSG2]|uniref:hypothetical protein n=1 Tax=Pyxidicoccus sp. MSG2 TaxID=2996790 RepID=UPI00227099CB|nr:hypothetical protein [Pyxidicoccus sp. MSG2]MCY1023223.1 hypothetical protein [Pyxidicoccus sp. MSG2]